jgi:hypothetical protein
MKLKIWSKERNGGREKGRSEGGRRASPLPSFLFCGKGNFSAGGGGGLA